MIAVVLFKSLFYIFCLFQICYNCREAGHDVANCPKLEASTESGSGICFKCGSTEHTLYQCRAKVPEG